MIYVYLIGGIILVAALSAGYEGILQADRAKQQAKIAAVEAEKKQLADQANADTQAQYTQIVSAYDKGQADALAKLNSLRPTINVTAPAFTNPACVQDQSVVDAINAARATVSGRLRDDPGPVGGVQAAPGSSGAQGAVPGSVPAQGRQTSDPAQPRASGHRPLGAVSTPAPGPR